jgi:hypothetical protein
LEGANPKGVTRRECASGTCEHRGLLPGVKYPGAAIRITAWVLVLKSDAGGNGRWVNWNGNASVPGNGR